MSLPTSGQLALYLYGDAGKTGQLPLDAVRLLTRASELIADETITAIYAVDSAGTPTDSKIVDAFTLATCAQVEYWVTGDEEDDVQGPLQGMSLGGQQQQFGAGTNRATPMYLAPRAARHLRVAGLLSGAVGDVGTSAQWNGQSRWVGL